jgi:hypothetical protein
MLILDRPILGRQLAVPIGRLEVRPSSREPISGRRSRRAAFACRASHLARMCGDRDRRLRRRSSALQSSPARVRTPSRRRRRHRPRSPAGKHHDYAPAPRVPSLPPSPCRGFTGQPERRKGTSRPRARAYDGDPARSPLVSVSACTPAGSASMLLAAPVLDRSIGFTCRRQHATCALACRA